MMQDQLQKLDCKKLDCKNSIAKNSIVKTQVQKNLIAKKLDRKNSIMKQDRLQKHDNKFENRCDCSRSIFVHNKPPQVYDMIFQG